MMGEIDRTYRSRSLFTAVGLLALLGRGDPICFYARGASPGEGRAETSSVGVAPTEDGFLFTEAGRKVLFYQRRPKALDGRFARAHYVHPLYGLDGEILTEDFPADHPHHRGIFWAWHQIRVGEERVGDSWALKDFSWDIRKVEILRGPSSSALKIASRWRSPRWTDENGEPRPIVEETTVIRVHGARDGMRKVDFEISLLALQDGVRIGGSEDRKGYGGFSTRVRLPGDVRCTGRYGPVEPRVVAVEAGPWVDISGSFAASEHRFGLTILPHPSTPGFPRKWILRKKGSAQNHAYPGRESTALSRKEPLTLRYRLIVHRGDLDPARIDAELDGYGERPPAGPLPGTRPLEWPEEDLSARLMDGAHRFVERMIAESVKKRERRWARDVSSPGAYTQSVAPNRQRFRKIIGVVDDRLPPGMEWYGDDANPSLVSETAAYEVYQVRWPVLEGVFGEGLLVRPRRTPVARAIALPDADRTPEQLVGLASGIEPGAQYVRWLAERGFEVVVPALVDRRKLVTDDPRLRRSDQTHRERIYRQAFHMGRHIVGYEVQKVLAAVDWFTTENDGRVGVVGYGEGGLIAFYAAAADTRIDAALVSGYFDSRQSVWSEPIYRNVWGLLREFGDAELASLILPRGLIIEYAPVPAVSGHKGELATPPLERVVKEYERVPSAGDLPRPVLVHGKEGKAVGPGSASAVRSFVEKLGVDSPMPLSDGLPRDRRQSFHPEARQKRTVQQLENHVQGLVRASEHVRDRFFLYQVMPQLASRKWSTERRHAVHSPKTFIEAARRYRRLFWEEAMGRFDEPMLPPNPRTRKILETESWIAYDVVLTVWKELFAWGVLVVPKGIESGERRPVVVCQHGRNGLPRDTIDGNKSAYNNFAAVLADRGFVTFAPHNLYRGEDRYRWLDRKANSVGASLFSFIIAQHDQILRWLETLPFVDGERMAFYGLSYGGETAVRVPAVLEKYCLSICSGDFNQWTRKVAATDQPFSFMNTIEWEMPYWNLGQTFDYAEMAYLIFPRPFMVERGHHDRVGRDRWVAHEYAKVRWLYAQFGLRDRTEIEFFQGGHSINGERTFEFLHNQLGWRRD